MKNDDLEKKLHNFNTREAAEQTMLSWIQTGLTLTGLGFGIASIVALMEAHHDEKTLIQMIKAIGLLLMIIGFASIILASMQHKSKIKSIRKKENPYTTAFNLSLALGVMIALLGIAAFFVILMHMIS